jgi:hypothetical protein
VPGLCIIAAVAYEKPKLIKANAGGAKNVWDGTNNWSGQMQCLSF